MIRRNEAPMDFAWEDDRSVCPTSPFVTAESKQRKSDPNSIFTGFSNPPAEKCQNEQSFLFSNPAKKLPASPFRKPLWTTPRKSFGLELSSGPEPSRMTPANNEDTPLDFMWQSSGPVDTTSPFVTASSKKHIRTFGSLSKNTSPPLKEPNTRTLFFSSLEKHPASPYRESSFTTPHNTSDFYFSSSPESSSIAPMDNEATPDYDPFFPTLPKNPKSNPFLSDHNRRPLKSSKGKIAKPANTIVKKSYKRRRRARNFEEQLSRTKKRLKFDGDDSDPDSVAPVKTPSMMRRSSMKTTEFERMFERMAVERPGAEWDAKESRRKEDYKRNKEAQPKEEDEESYRLSDERELERTPPREQTNAMSYLSSLRNLFWPPSRAHNRDSNRGDLSLSPERNKESTDTYGLSQSGYHLAYGNTTVSGRATAVLGNVHGGVHIQNTFLLSRSTYKVPQPPHWRIERHNSVTPSYTIETITTYDGGDGAIAGSASYKTVLRWKRKEHLGAGAFSEVHREECFDDKTRKSRAVKVLRLRQLRRLKVDYKYEIGALLRLCQPQYLHRFVEFFSWYEDIDNIFLAMEYFANGDLSKYIEERGLIDQSDVKQIGYQVLDGIRIIHHLDIIHRDIKPGNIFIVKPSPEWWVKIGDFGISKSTLTDLTTLHTSVGTRGYQAPEIAGFIAPEKKDQYDAKCDIWSYGCMLYQLLTGELPFKDLYDLSKYCRSQLALSEVLQRAGMDATAKIFVTALLQCSPSKRPAAEQAFELGQSWFQLSAPGQATTTQSDLNLEVTFSERSISHATQSIALPQTDVGFVEKVDESVKDSPIEYFFEAKDCFNREVAKNAVELEIGTSTSIGSPDLLPKTLKVSLHQ